MAGWPRSADQSAWARRIDFSDVFASATPTGDTVKYEAAHETKTMPRATTTFTIMQGITCIDDDQDDLRRDCDLSLWVWLDENC
jgi:hypothetical protein